MATTVMDINSRAPKFSMGASSALLIAIAAGGAFGTYTVPIRAEQTLHRRVEIGHDNLVVLELLADVEDTLERLEQFEVVDRSLYFADAPDVPYDSGCDWEVMSAPIRDVSAPTYNESDFDVWV